MGRIVFLMKELNFRNTKAAVEFGKVLMKDWDSD
jgi:hypothetical protein